MSNNHGAATADDPMDMAEHEIDLCRVRRIDGDRRSRVLLCVLLMLVLWGLEGHGFVALVGLILTLVRGHRRQR